MYNGCREVDEHAQIQFVGRMDRRNHACGSGVSRRKTTQNNAKQQKKNRKCCIRLRRKSSARPAPSCRIGASITDWVKIFAVAARPVGLLTRSSEEIEFRRKDAIGQQLFDFVEESTMYFPPNAPEKLSGTYTGIFQQTTRKSLISCWFAFFCFFSRRKNCGKRFKKWLTNKNFPLKYSVKLNVNC